MLAAEGLLSVGPLLRLWNMLICFLSGPFPKRVFLSMVSLLLGTLCSNFMAPSQKGYRRARKDTENCNPNDPRVRTPFLRGKVKKRLRGDVRKVHKMMHSAAKVDKENIFSLSQNNSGLVRRVTQWKLLWSRFRTEQRKGIFYSLEFQGTINLWNSLLQDVAQAAARGL